MIYDLDFKSQQAMVMTHTPQHMQKSTVKGQAVRKVRAETSRLKDMTKFITFFTNAIDKKAQ